MMDYAAFLASKRKISEPAGFEPTMPINPMLRPDQRDICSWSLRRGRSAVFSDCGTGKSGIELEWARHVSAYSTGDVLVLTPLAVTHQMGREGEKFGVPVTVCRSAADVRPGVNATNYDRLHHFNPKDFSGVVLDESSCLKAFEGAMRKRITEFAKSIPFRLAATATPAPNDLIELTNHAEFLDVMTGKEIIALFFTQDGNTTQKWRLKGHARRDFWRWLASWAVAMRKPSDLGYSDEGFELPELTIEHVTVESKPLPGEMFAMPAKGLAGHRKAARASLEDRCRVTADLVNGDVQPWIVWRKLLDESALLRKLIPDSVEVRGSDEPEFKEAAVVSFIEGRTRVLITDPTICGFGLNLQSCSRMAFAGSTFSYEQWYQAIRRCWRFGQREPVRVYLVASEAESDAVDAVRVKEVQAAEMMAELVAHMKGFSLGRSGRDEMEYNPDVEMHLPSWMRGAVAR